MNYLKILAELESKTEDKQELSYFWTHEVRYKEILKKIQEISGGKKLKILDVGCYPYHIGFALEKMGHDVYGIASKHEKVNKNKVEILNIEKDKLPFLDNFFDLVLFNEIIEHLPNSPLSALSEIYRVTKKGGEVIITTPNIARSINRVKLLTGKNIMYPISVFFEENGFGNNIYHRHNREYVLEEVIVILKSISWEIAKSEQFISYTPFRKRLKADSLLMKTGKIINHFIMLLFPNLRDTIFVVAKKLG